MTVCKLWNINNGCVLWFLCLCQYTVTVKVHKSNATGDDSKSKIFYLNCNCGLEEEKHDPNDYTCNHSVISAFRELKEFSSRIMRKYTNCKMKSANDLYFFRRIRFTKDENGNSIAYYSHERLGEIHIKNNLLNWANKLNLKMQAPAGDRTKQRTKYTSHSSRRTVATIVEKQPELTLSQEDKAQMMNHATVEQFNNYVNKTRDDEAKSMLTYVFTCSYNLY